MKENYIKYERSLALVAAEAAVKEYKETQQRLEVEREQIKQAGENASLSMHYYLPPCMT